MDNVIGFAGWIVSGDILREKTLTLLEFPELCASHGVKMVELCSRFFESQDAQYLNQLRRKLEDNDLTVQNMAVDMGNIEALKTWFYTASAIGSRAIRINTGHADDAGAMTRVVDAYKELAKVGEQAGVKLLIENHGGVSSTSDNLERILGGVISPWFATCPDTGNFPEGDWEAGMQVLSPRAFSAHVKVFSYSEDGIQTRTGRDGKERKYDLKKCLKILKDAGYRGPLCIESGASENSRDNMRDALAYMKKLVAEV
ncbi:sugar phosphate isomerase/epimerase family protein [Candidatus Poribacteria bacterium]